MSTAIASPVVRLHLELEADWSTFLDANFPGERQLLRWGQEHRVYRVGDRVLKIEMASLGERDHSRSIHYEYEMLEVMEGRACHFNPTYRVIDNHWCVLEIDWIDGAYLDNLIKQGRGRQASVVRLLWLLFKISLAGVAYKQLRARHVIRRRTGELALIDFGISHRANPLRALWENFVPFRFTAGQLAPSRILSIIVEILRHKEPSRAERSHAIEAGVRRWSVNPKRPPEGKPPHLANNPGDPRAAEQLALMETCLQTAVAANPNVAADLNEVHFAEYGLGAPRDWGFIWDYIANRVDFAGKAVVDLGSGMGAVGVFAALGGASSVIGLDDDPNLIRAAEHFSAGLQIDVTRFEQTNSLAQTTMLDQLPAGDVLALLSTRTEDLPHDDLLATISNFDEILWQTPAPEQVVADLRARGFRTVDVLVDGALGRKIIYATDRATQGTK